MAGLDRTRQQWERLGRDDPLWGVLTDASKKGNLWDTEEFLANGRSEIGSVMERVRALGIEPLGPALDLGCGAGRLTQALGQVLGATTGVDISAAMVAKARELNRLGDVCQFEQNSGRDLSQFGDDSFGFIYSALVLQHMPSSVAEHYLAEFCRVLRPGGVMVFQIPIGKARGYSALRTRLKLVLTRAWRRMDINIVPADRIEKILTEGQCSILDRELDWRTGGGWRSMTFVAVKAQ